MKYLIIVLILFSTVTGFSQSIQLVPEKMDTVHVKVSEATYKGKKSVRVIGNNYNAEELAIIKNIVFNDGTIELDVSGVSIHRVPYLHMIHILLVFLCVIVATDNRGLIYIAYCDFSLVGLHLSQGLAANKNIHISMYLFRSAI